MNKRGLSAFAQYNTTAILKTFPNARKWTLTNKCGARNIKQNNETLDEYWRIIPMIGVNGNECHEILVTKGNHSKRINIALLKDQLKNDW